MAKSTTVQTVVGPISTADLGGTLSHEHLVVAPAGIETDANFPFDHEGELLKAIGEMKKLQAAGISTIVDPIPMELGRNVGFMADVAAGSAMNIICATGLYYESGPFQGFPTYYKTKHMAELAELYVKEIAEGIGPRKIRAGVIKCATSANQITDNERKALQAAARASNATGVPITTHTEEGSMGPEQLEIFESEGVDPSRVTIGHCSDSADIVYLQKILKRGAFVGFDRVGLEHRSDDEAKLGVVTALVAMGYERQVVLSHDNVGCMHGFRPRPPDPKRRFTYLAEEFIPRMKASGVSEQAIHTMLVDNPRRYFEGA